MVHPVGAEEEGAMNTTDKLGAVEKQQILSQNFDKVKCLQLLKRVLYHDEGKKLLAGYEMFGFEKEDLVVLICKEVLLSDYVNTSLAQVII
mmetsp:Transcript_49848/g.75266  ORF Transcript_49848/g.75266 Transcript_49848/m.75266 type:complete len:91 (+) Transcript_49848:147-419(+)